MRRRAFLTCAVVGTLSCLMQAPPARASLVLAMELPEMTAQADRIVVGEIVRTSSGWDTLKERILTTIEVRVAEAWKGQDPAARTLVIVQPGGVVDGLEMRVHGLPAFQTGERAVLFLRQGAAHHALVGLGQGKRPLRWESVARRWWVDAGDRSAAIHRTADGKFHPAPAEPGMSLDDLRVQVRALVGGR